MAADAIEHSWQELESEASQGDRQDTVVRRLLPESTTDLFLGYTRAGEVRMMLIGINAAESATGFKLPRTRGLEVTVRSYPHFMPHANLLVVSLLLPPFKRMFSVMVWETALELRGINRDEDRIAAVINGILRWQQLLEKLAPEGLTPESQRGLFGELYFLRGFVFQQLPPGKAIRSWAGPSGSDQDFQFVRCAVEVKTTTSKRPEAIQIASEKQLDCSLVPALYLIHLRLAESVGDGEKLPSLIEEIREKIMRDQAAWSEFDSKLLNIGYHDSQAQLYDRIGYKVQTVTVYHVQGEFPRIEGSNVRNGVGDIRYSITVSECNHYRIDEVDLRREMTDDADDS